MVESSLRPMRRARHSSRPAGTSKIHWPSRCTIGIGNGQLSGPITSTVGLPGSETIRCPASESARYAFRTCGSSTGSPDETSSCEPGPRMLTTDLLSPLLAAWTSASTASSGVLKSCCSCASEDSARISIAAPASMVILLKRRTYCDLIMAVHPSMRLRWGGGNPRARGEPLVVGVERQPELVVVDAQISVVAADDCIRSNDVHFLRHHADISLV